MRSGNPHIEQRWVKKKTPVFAKKHKPPLPPMTNSQYRMIRAKKIKQRDTPRRRAQYELYKRHKRRYLHTLLDKYKVCNRCHERKTFADFYLQNDSTHPRKQLKSICISCRKKDNAIAYMKRKREGYYDTK